MEENKVKMFIGNIIHCPEKLKIELLENGYIVVQGKQIIALGDSTSLGNQLNIWRPQQVEKIFLKSSQILVPGFVDTHIHAPQYPNSGLGYDKTLLNWLDCYTYKLERKYKDLKFAKTVFDAVVRKTLTHGTTTACYFGSLFTDASIVLVDSVIKHGQRALVGKINMTKNTLNDYVETEEESIVNTVKFVEDVVSRKNDLVQPVITPRFAISVDIEHLTKLAQIAKNNNLNIQTHISENLDEIQVVKEIFGMSYANVYESAKILTEKTLLAHGVHLTHEELELISKRGSSISHCPDSNTCLKSGLCDVQKLLNYGIKVGLGTDISGGPSPSIRKVMKSALDVSVHLSFGKEDYKPLNYFDVFYLATLGGAEALGMENKIGNFLVGKEFDALIIDMDLENAETDYLVECTPMELLQKFIYCGDDRNIVNVFVAGKNVKC